MRRHRAPRAASALLSCLVLACQAPASEGSGGEVEAQPAIPSGPLEPFTLTLPASSITLEMVPIPAAEVDGEVQAAFWIARHEVSWDAFDHFLFGAAPGADAVTRPSAPYISMDRGFGHEGWPVLSLSAKNARAFAAWLSAWSGGSFRLPTEAEWQRACGERPDDVQAHAWCAENAGGKTHPPGEKLPNEHGLHDMLGNAAEWCIDEDGIPFVAGGSYRDPAARLGPKTRARQSSSWNRSDPQIPKSVWWLADGGFVGLRVVCDSPPPPTEN